MTGYGESRFTIEGVKFHFRVRSLNSRYLETEFNFANEFAWLEARFEPLLRQKFSRGKLQVYLEADRNLPKKVALDKSAVATYKQVLGEFYRKKNISIPIEVLVQMPGVFEMKTTHWQDHLSRFEFYFLRATLKAQRMRTSEGKKIKQWMRPRIRLLMRYNQKINILQERSYTRKKRELRKRFRKLEGGEKAPRAVKLAGNKLWAEAKDELVEYFQADISEEIERLGMHLPEVLKIIDKEANNGKKLEFYFQELLREVNTLTSKTADSQINQLGILMKIEVEKLREQVRNVA